MARAMRVTEENLSAIAAMNDGIAPHRECVDNLTYFIDPEHPTGQNQLLAGEVFHDNYMFATPQKENILVEIEEL